MELRKGFGGVSSYSDIINEASLTYGVDPSIITAIIQQESAGNSNAVSKVGAQGLMQLMPATATQLGVSNPFDPTQNIMGGTKYISSLISKYNGDVSQALAAYNFGPGNVDSGKSWPSETVNYVSKILGNVGSSLNNSFDFETDTNNSVSDYVDNHSGIIEIAIVGGLVLLAFIGL